MEDLTPTVLTHLTEEGAPQITACILQENNKGTSPQEVRSTSSKISASPLRPSATSGGQNPSRLPQNAASKMAPTVQSAFKPPSRVPN
ncbi:MAG: hypothetical protein Q9204_007098 [Flavoplaca sp. TL-2023a]